MKDSMIDLLKELVSINTDSTKRLNYDEIVDLITRRAESYGLNAQRIADEKSIPHLVLTIPDAPEGKRVIFLTHYDVVPAGPEWKFDPFDPFEEGGKIFGRGASDDKSGVAVGLMAFKEAVEEKLEPTVDPILVVAGGEETGEGADFFQGLEGDIGVVLDSGPDGLSIGASGVVRVEVKVKGEQSHSAYPFLSENAIYRANELIASIERKGRELEKKTSRYDAPVHYEKIPARMNVTVAKGGVAPNVIPGEFEFTIDRRTLPEEDAGIVAKKLEDELKEEMDELGMEAEVIAEKSMDGWATEDKEVIDGFASILEEILGKRPKVFAELGATDGVHLIDRMPVIQFGALRGDNRFHGKNEFVWIKDVELTKEFVKKTVTSLDPQALFERD